MHTLYYAPGAASMLVHWLLIDLDVPHALVLIDTAAGEQKQPSYLALNPSGVLPTLVIDGVPHYEAAGLALYLADRHPYAALTPAADDAKRVACYQWMFHLANVVQPLFRQWWYPHEPAGEANADAVRDAVAARIAPVWDRIDAHLGSRGPYLLGDRLSVADFYLVMLMRWSRYMPRPATDWRQLLKLSAVLKARSSFATVCAREGLTEWL